LRGLGRIGRLRWLTGRRSPEGNWDAYEAVPGQPLVSLLGQRRPWREVRFWLLDLAEELTLAAREGNSPSRLALDQVWITADGRAKLLDFPAPGVEPATDAAGQQAPAGAEPAQVREFLHEIAHSALEGKSLPAAAAQSAAPAVPLPLRARRFFESLPALPSAEAIVQPLRELAGSPAEATRGRRLTLILALGLPSLVLGLMGIFIGRALDRSVKKYPEVQPLLLHLLRLDDLKRNGWHGVMEHKGGPATPAEIKLVEQYIARRFGPVVHDARQWNSQWVRNTLGAARRAEAERIVAAYPSVSQADFDAATKLVEPLLGPLGETGFNPLGGDSGLTFFMGLAAVGWLVWMAFFSVCAAVLCRGGLLLWALGLTFVRSDGKPASRLRVLWRALVAWSPLVLLPIVPALVLPALQASQPEAIMPAEALLVLGTIGGLVCLAYLALVVWSALLPERGIPDRLAGTWLVPR
jgi:hypothetical protein